MSAAVCIVPWGEDGLGLLEQLVGDPRMMEHLGGAESPEKVRRRQLRYAAPDSGMFKIVDLASGQGVGSVGFWGKQWQDEQILETGWSVIPAFQGRGLAAAAAAQAVELARASRRLQAVRTLHAFPAVENTASNAICRRLGFTFLREAVVEYPPGHSMTCNDWCLDLAADAHRPRALGHPQFERGGVRAAAGRLGTP